MAYSRRNQRLLFTGLGLVCALAAVLMMAYAFRDTASFFFTPEDVLAGKAQSGQQFRLGGLVAQNSVVSGEDATRFFVEDGVGQVSVKYTGILPALFGEGQGVVAEGSLDDSLIFTASRILAKHDETYLPREVADSLKKQGVWNGEAQ